MATLNSCCLLQRAESSFGVETTSRTLFLRKTHPARTRTQFFQFHLRRQTLYFPCEHRENQSCSQWLVFIKLRICNLWNCVKTATLTVRSMSLVTECVISLYSKLTSANTKCGALLRAPSHMWSVDRSHDSPTRLRNRLLGFDSQERHRLHKFTWAYLSVYRVDIGVKAAGVLIWAFTFM
jgi:hypothetical protein